MRIKYLMVPVNVLLISLLIFMIGCGGGGGGTGAVPDTVTTVDPGGSFGTITGRVLDPDNNALADAAVSIEGLSLNAITDSQGNYSINNVPAGKQKCIASKNGYIQAYNHGEVLNGQNITVDIIMPPDSWNDPLVMNDINNLGQEALNYLAEQKAITGDDRQARENTVSWLQSNTSVQEAALMKDNKTIKYKTSYGMERYILPDMGDNINNTRKAVLTESGFKDNNLNSTSTDKSLILVPCRFQEGDIWDNYGLKFMLENWGYGDNVTYRYNLTPDNPSYITKDTWTGWFDDSYDLIVISTHGGYVDNTGVILSTGISAASWPDSQAEVNNGYIVITANNIVAITPQFIYNYYQNGSMNATRVLYCGACEGLFDESMSDAFLSKGVKMYYGWTRPVAIVYSIKTSLDLLGSMLSGDTLDEAYNRVKTQYVGYSDGTVDPLYTEQAQLKYDDNYGGYGSTKLREYNPDTGPSDNPSTYSCKWFNQCGYPATNESSIYLWVNFKNTGTSTWYRSDKYPVYLGTSNEIDRASPLSHFLWIGNNRPCSLVQKYVNPGHIGTFVFFIQHPGVHTTYREYFRPVVENVAWLEDYGVFWDITFAPNIILNYTASNDFSNPLGGILPVGNTGDADITIY